MTYFYETSPPERDRKGFVWQHGLSGHRSQISGGQELYD